MTYESTYGLVRGGTGMVEKVASTSASSQLSMVRNKEISSRELLELCMSRYTAANPALNAVVVTDLERALAAADAADQALAQGRSFGPLHGLPMTVKDAIATAGMRTTGGADELSDHMPTEDAPAVARLRDAGAVIYGKTNVPRWSMEIQTHNSVYGTTNNPWRLDHTPGGSSGGAAAAVAAGLCSLELGTDIGGSVRIPASFCGIYAHKPSYGIVSQRGYISHIDAGRVDADMNVFGPLARSVEDLELALDVLAAPEADMSPAWHLRLPPSRAASLRELRVGLWLDDVACQVDGEVARLLDAAVQVLVKEHATVIDARPDLSLQDTFDTYLRLVFAAQSTSMNEDNARKLGGWHVDWLRNNAERARIRTKFAEYFRDHDVLLCPVMPMPPFPHDHTHPQSERTVVVNGNPRPHLECMHWMGSFGVAYLPATVVPIGRTTTGLPVGLQIVGPYLADRTTLFAAAEMSKLLGGYSPPPDTDV